MGLGVAILIATIIVVSTTRGGMDTIRPGVIVNVPASATPPDTDIHSNRPIIVNPPPLPPQAAAGPLPPQQQQPPIFVVPGGVVPRP